MNSINVKAKRRGGVVEGWSSGMLESGSAVLQRSRIPLRLLFGVFMTFQKFDRFNLNPTVEMGSARAARAVFRALAENLERTKRFQPIGQMSCAQWLDARRVQRHPRRVCSPTSVFRFNVPFAVRGQERERGRKRF